jgi:hypothetical protein
MDRSLHEHINDLHDWITAGKQTCFVLRRPGLRWVVCQLSAPGGGYSVHRRIVAGPFWRKRLAQVHLEIHRALETK